MMLHPKGAILCKNLSKLYFFSFTIGYFFFCQVAPPSPELKRV